MFDRAQQNGEQRTIATFQCNILIRHYPLLPRALIPRSQQIAHIRRMISIRVLACVTEERASHLRGPAASSAAPPAALEAQVQGGAARGGAATPPAPAPAPAPRCPPRLSLPRPPPTGTCRTPPLCLCCSTQPAAVGRRARPGPAGSGAPRSCVPGRRYAPSSATGSLRKIPATGPLCLGARGRSIRSLTQSPGL